MPIDLFVGKSSVQTNIYVFRVNESHKADDIVKFIDFSGNVIAVRKAKGETKRRIILSGHIDSAPEWTYTYKLGSHGAIYVAVPAILGLLYTGATGRVAHECIIDVQKFKEEFGVDATDIAKRMMDFGFHAPTLSFPVHETLMVEPTESEPLSELERFIEMMKTIKQECEDIKAGKLDKVDNPLKMSPHTADEVCGNEWNHSYPREQAAFPAEWIRENKFWPYVTRVDNGWGDRNLKPCVD